MINRLSRNACIMINAERGGCFLSSLLSRKLFMKLFRPLPVLLSAVGAVRAVAAVTAVRTVAAVGAVGTVAAVGTVRTVGAVLCVLALCILSVRAVILVACLIAAILVFCHDKTPPFFLTKSSIPSGSEIIQADQFFRNFFRKWFLKNCFLKNWKKKFFYLL